MTTAQTVVLLAWGQAPDYPRFDCTRDGTLGESGWCSGHHSRLPLLRPRFDSRAPQVSWDLLILILLRGFFSGYSDFSPSAKATPCLVHLAVVLCSEVMHGLYSLAERLTRSTAPSVQSCQAAPFAIQSQTARKVIRVIIRAWSLKATSLKNSHWARV